MERGAAWPRVEGGGRCPARVAGRVASRATWSCECPSLLVRVMQHVHRDASVGWRVAGGRSYIGCMRRWQRHASIQKHSGSACSPICTPCLATLPGCATTLRRALPLTSKKLCAYDSRSSLTMSMASSPLLTYKSSPMSHWIACRRPSAYTAIGLVYARGMGMRVSRHGKSVPPHVHVYGKTMRLHHKSHVSCLCVCHVCPCNIYAFVMYMRVDAVGARGPCLCARTRADRPSRPLPVDAGASRRRC